MPLENLKRWREVHARKRVEQFHLRWLEDVTRADDFQGLAEVTEALGAAPHNPAVVTVGSIHGGTRYNIIPDEVNLQLTVRTYKEEVRRRVLASIERMLGAYDDVQVLGEFADGRSALRSIKKLGPDVVFLDVQIGRRGVPAEIDGVRKWLEQPHVHLALDPEFAMDEGEIPGEHYGHIDAADVLYADNGAVKGVVTGDMGIGRDGQPTDAYQPGMELHGKYTFFAEGAPRVTNAAVSIRDALTGIALTNGATSAQGFFRVPQVPAGYYDLEVSARDHSTYRRTILTPAGGGTHVTAFLSRQVVRYVWTVVPTEIEPLAADAREVRHRRAE